MLDKRPDLIRDLGKVIDTDQGERKTLVEGTAELIQRAFTICLTERTANKNGVGRDNKPEGKKVGIYSFANMVLKLLFQVRFILSPELKKCTTNTLYSAGKHGLQINFLQTSWPTLHLLVFIQQAIESNTYISLDDTISQMASSSTPRNAFNLHTINATQNSYLIVEPS